MNRATALFREVVVVLALPLQSVRPLVVLHSLGSSIAERESDRSWYKLVIFRLESYFL